jgi:hypothetical protein
VEMVLRNCRGIVLKDSGYWHTPEDDTVNPTSSVSAPLTGTQSSNPALTQRRREHSERLNMPRWTPGYRALSFEEGLALVRSRNRPDHERRTGVG